MKIHFDCKHYLGYKPCRFHKLDGRLCEGCPSYRKIRKKILIVKLDALGDVLRTTSILPALHEKYEDPGITWITRRNAVELLKTNPLIHRVHTVEENYLEYVLNEVFDEGICLDADPLSASILALATCGVKRGFTTNRDGQVMPVNDDSRQWFLMGVNDQLKRENRTTYQKHIYTICGLESEIKKPQIYIDAESRDFARYFSGRHQLGGKKIVGINTGGGNRWQLKKWVQTYYIKLVQMLKHIHPNVGIVLYGGPEEVEFNRKITDELGDLVVDAGCGNSLMRFAALIDLADVYFTPDSLGMHISIALDKPTVVNVGPTSPWELDVYDNGAIIYNDSLDCISCYLATCDKKVNCGNTLKPEQVFEEIARYL